MAEAVRSAPRSVVREQLTKTAAAAEAEATRPKAMGALAALQGAAAGQPEIISVRIAAGPGARGNVY